MIGCLLTLKFSSCNSSCMMTGILGGNASVLNISSLPALRFLNGNIRMISMTMEILLVKNTGNEDSQEQHPDYDESRHHECNDVLL